MRDTRMLDCAAEPAMPMRILVAEDDPASRILLRSVLEKWGYSVLVVEDGEAAWDALCREDAPDIAIVDWMMPRLSGVDVCKRLRALTREPVPYVVLLTAKGLKSDVVEALDAGADDYLVKPFDFGELAARVRVAKRSLTTQRELIAARELIRRQATTDLETGALNRSTAVAALARETGRGTAAVALIAVDRYELLEQQLGIVRMEEALRAVVTRLRALLSGRRARPVRDERVHAGHARDCARRGDESGRAGAPGSLPDAVRGRRAEYRSDRERGRHCLGASRGEHCRMAPVFGGHGSVRGQGRRQPGRVVRHRRRPGCCPEREGSKLMYGMVNRAIVDLVVELVVAVA